MKLVDFGLVALLWPELWHDLLTSMAVASNPESSEEQIPNYRLLTNTTVQSVQQIRW